MKKIFLLLILLAIMPMEAQGAQAREILYEHALTRAITRNPSIVPLDRESRQLAAQAKQAMDESAQITGQDRVRADLLQGTALQLNADSRKLERERSRLILSVELSLRNNLATIAGMELDLAVLEKQIALQDQTLEHTKLRREHGMASDLDVREAESALEQSKLNLEMLTLNLQNERHNLNRLINQPITSNIRIIYDHENLEPIPQDPERFITQQIPKDHNLQNWQDEVAARHHNWQTQLNVPEVSNTNMRLQHQLATLERNLAQTQAELSIRSALADWERLLEEQQELESRLEQTKSDHKDMQTRQESGQATQLQTSALALQSKIQESQLTKHQYKLWTTRLRIDHPYIR